MTIYCTSEQNEDPSHNHAINGCKPWPGQCRKHHHGYHVLPCPHCAEDAKVLEERLRAVASLIVPAHEDAPRHLVLLDALRDLVREVGR